MQQTDCNMKDKQRSFMVQTATQQYYKMRENNLITRNIATQTGQLWKKILKFIPMWTIIYNQLKCTNLLCFKMSYKFYAHSNSIMPPTTIPCKSLS